MTIKEENPFERKAFTEKKIISIVLEEMQPDFISDFINVEDIIHIEKRYGYRYIREDDWEKHIEKASSKAIKKCQDAQDKQVEELKKKLISFSFTPIKDSKKRYISLEFIKEKIDKIFKKEKK